MIRAESTIEELDGAPSDGAAPSRPPVQLLLFGLISVLVSGVLVGSSGTVAHVAGYLFGSVVTIGFVGLFHRADRQRRQHPRYVPRRVLSRYAGLVAALGIAVAAMHTWWIATELAK